MTYLDSVSKSLNETSRSKGFYDTLDMTEFNDQAKQLAMIHSEVSETLEALRKSMGEQKVVEEIADILIRTFDFYEALRREGVVTLSLDEVFDGKANTNKERPRMHGVLG